MLAERRCIDDEFMTHYFALTFVFPLLLFRKMMNMCGENFRRSNSSNCSKCALFIFDFNFRH